MKDFLVMLALIPILLYFPAQFTADEINDKKIVAYNNIISKHAQVARAEGCFTADNINSLKQELSNALYIDVSEIRFEGTTTQKYRTDAFDNRQMLSYKVSVPVKRIIAMPKLWGMTDGNNKVDYSVSGEVATELLP